MEEVKAWLVKYSCNATLALSQIWDVSFLLLAGQKARVIIFVVSQGSCLCGTVNNRGKVIYCYGDLVPRHSELFSESGSSSNGRTSPRDLLAAQLGIWVFGLLALWVIHVLMWLLTNIVQAGGPPVDKKVHHLTEEAHREGDWQTASVSRWGWDDVPGLRASVPRTATQGHHAGVNGWSWGESPSFSLLHELPSFKL